MNNIFGVIVKPIFDENIFKVGGPVVVTDYQNNLEFSAIIAMTSPVFVEVLYYDKEINNGKFMKIHIDSFINGSFGLHPLVKQPIVDKPSNVDDNINHMEIVPNIELEDSVPSEELSFVESPVESNESNNNIDDSENSYDGVLNKIAEVYGEDASKDYGDNYLESYAKNYYDFENDTNNDADCDNTEELVDEDNNDNSEEISNYSRKSKFGKRRR